MVKKKQEQEKKEKEEVKKKMREEKLRERMLKEAARAREMKEVTTENQSVNSSATSTAELQVIHTIQGSSTVPVVSSLPPAASPPTSFEPTTPIISATLTSPLQPSPAYSRKLKFKSIE